MHRTWKQFLEVALHIMTGWGSTIIIHLLCTVHENDFLLKQPLKKAWKCLKSSNFIWKSAKKTFMTSNFCPILHIFIYILQWPCFGRKSAQKSYRFVLKKRQISQNTYSVLTHIQVYPIVAKNSHGKLYWN